MDELRLEKASSAPPAYQQIISFYESRIRSRKLRPGDKLPPERDLARELGTARGTVKRAYEELVRRGLVEASPGRGSFVSAATAELPSEDRKEKAVRLIDGLLDQLGALRFNAQEIRVFFDLRVLAREDELRNLSVAAVDCNPEALSIFENQFLLIPYVTMAKILLDDLVEDPAASARLQSFDLILTTTTHYQDLVDRFPEVRPKTVQAAVAPTRGSIVSLARLTPSQKIGVVCESKRFLDIVLDHLKAFEIPADNVASLFASQADRLGEFVSGLDAVIVPAGFSLQKHKDHLAALQAFTERGGVVVSFDYQIERGSILHVEERLRAMLEDRARSGR